MAKFTISKFTALADIFEARAAMAYASEGMANDDASSNMMLARIMAVAMLEVLTAMDDDVDSVKQFAAQLRKHVAANA